MPSADQSQQKQQLRRHLRQLRQALSAEQVQKNSQIIVEKLINSDVWTQSKHIGLYLPINNEVDLSALLTFDKLFYIPAIYKNTMQFHLYSPHTPLTTTHYGLTQPEFIADYQAPKLDLCLLPLLGFDDKGHRLGMGGGFYDRYFADNTGTMLVGVAHALQQLDKLPIDPWDVKLQGIITEQQWLTL
ncbi:5-formyltetrahydrofolate cyclo-ligase [Marinicella gelatinilytica]|uniref:5-formyltetrahydrofolate cyclo-ligase n=1 Tax=Marinicella gelatinilytica TaxID=2996017 RepID=UPI002260F0A5|nr:5-formyltetrahydrofolate cyclo-ligase [Marinicella gelatinilytica]MCX7545974.1 5-formyltetrahydrofolate cyclo-ligase [Marinicella gelatinilytica]